jgi:Transposase DDE domain
MAGKAPRAPTEAPQAKDQVSLTDEESRIMPTRPGFEQAYNAQASVAIATHLIVGHHVTQQANDKPEIKPALAQLKQLPECLGTVENLLADTGYFSQGNVNAGADATIKPTLAQQRQSHNQSLEARHQHEPEIDETTLPPLEAMTHRLATQTGKALYGKRKSTVETVSGLIKHVLGFRPFHLRGLDSVQSEWNTSVSAGI